MLRPKALDHVGLVVTDMDRSLRFYTEALGLELLRRSGQGASSANSAVLKVGDQEINVFCRPNLIASGKELQRIDHFCLTMESATMDDLMRALSQTTIDIVSGPVERRDGTSVFVNDPDGVRVELLIKK